jgi:hypothetical protein
MQPKTAFQALAAATLTLGLLACGGGDEPALPEPSDTDRRVSTTAATPADPIAPLLDDEGHVMPSSPQSEPADAGARTRAMRYSSAGQADMLEHAHPSAVLRVNVAGSGAEAVEQGVQLAYDLQAAARLGNDAPVLVAGADLRSAAAVADRLAELGMTRVWLVTP